MIPFTAFTFWQVAAGRNAGIWVIGAIIIIIFPVHLKFLHLKKCIIKLPTLTRLLSLSDGCLLGGFHPLRNLIAMGKVILIGAVILLFLIIVSLLGQMSGTTSTSVFGTNRIEDVQTLVQEINDYRNAAVTEGIYQAFQNDVDPNGNPYGYDSLTGQRSNNLQHGVTWNYANGIYNDTRRSSLWQRYITSRIFHNKK